jgi:arylsulfatase A-like enzyme
VHYEHSASVPLIFNWGGRLRQGMRVRNIVQSIDLFPTIAELAGVVLPPGVQGRSQAAVLTGATTDTGYDAALIDSYTKGVESQKIAQTQNQRSGRPRAEDDVYTLRSLQWRYSYYPGQDYGELYDLESDSNEFVNRWDDPGLKATRHRLQVELMERIIQARDPLPVRTHPY